MIKSRISILKSYIPIVDFIAEVFGSNCEVVLHDVINIDKSIITIKNNHISNRKVGGPLTDLALKILNEKKYTDKEFLVNYTGKTKDGKLLRSSTYFIKDELRNIIGMLCVNIDITSIVSAKKFLDELTMGVHESSSNTFKNDNMLPENFSDSIEDLMYSIIEKTILDYNITPERMTPEEKMEIVIELNKKGVFLLKGAVFEVAKHLKTSEATIYRYLNKDHQK